MPFEVFFNTRIEHNHFSDKPYLEVITRKTIQVNLSKAIIKHVLCAPKSGISIIPVRKAPKHAPIWSMASTHPATLPPS
jgi:hypothetical protein